MSDYLRRFQKAAWVETPGGKYPDSSTREMQRAFLDWLKSGDPLEPEMRVHLLAAFADVVDNRQRSALFEPVVTARPKRPSDDTSIIPAVRYVVAAGPATSPGRGEAVRVVAQAFGATPQAVRIWVREHEPAVRINHGTTLDDCERAMRKAADRYRKARK